MSKVLVDQELLTEAVESLSDGLEDGPMESEASIADRTLVLRLKAAITRPAEAEGVEVVAYVGCQARMTTEGWENGEEYLVFADQATDADKRYDVPLMTVTQHLAALSAVTAERDRLDAECGRLLEGKIQDAETIYILEAERDQLRAEVEALRAFSNEIISGAFDGGSFDGGDIQGMGVKHGLLRIEQREDECGEFCACREYGFPSECYRKTGLLVAAIDAALQGEHP